MKSYFAYCSLASFALAIATTPAIAADDFDTVRHGDGSKGIVVNSFGKCVRTKWQAGNDECAPPAPPAPKPEPVAAPAPKPAPQPRIEIRKEDRTALFEFNKSDLTDEAKQVLGSLATKLKADDQVKQARIVGYADRIGSDKDNEALSQRRADSVREYLIAQGFVKLGETETRWLGESTPATQCDEKLKRKELIECLAPDRRVEVEIDYETTVIPAE